LYFDYIQDSAGLFGGVLGAIYLGITDAEGFVALDTTLILAARGLPPTVGCITGRFA